MPLIFDDFIQASDCSGLYTLMGYVNGTWQDIHTIYGPSTGSIEVDASFNTIEVDTTLFIPGGTYQFKWVDGNGVSSNIITLTIPVESGSGSGSGSGLVSPSIVISNAEPGQVIVDIVAPASQQYIPLARLWYTDSSGTWVESNDQPEVGSGTYTLYESGLLPGASCYATITLGSNTIATSQTVTLAGAGSYSGSGSGSNPFSVVITGIDSGNLFAQVSGDITTVPGYNPNVSTYATIYFSPTGSGAAFVPYTGGLDQEAQSVGQIGWNDGDLITLNPAGLVPGNDYELVITNSNTVMATSPVVTLPSIDSGSSCGDSSSGSGSGALSPTLTIIDAEVGQVEIMLNGISGGYSSPQYTVNGNENGPFNFTQNEDGSFTLAGSDIVAGASIQASMYIEEIGWYIYSQVVIIPDASSYSSSGSGAAPDSTVMLTGTWLPSGGYLDISGYAATLAQSDLSISLYSSISGSLTDPANVLVSSTATNVGTGIYQVFSVSGGLSTGRYCYTTVTYTGPDGTTETICSQILLID